MGSTNLFFAYVRKRVSMLYMRSGQVWTYLSQTDQKTTTNTKQNCGACLFLLLCNNFRETTPFAQFLSDAYIKLARDI